MLFKKPPKEFTINGEKVMISSLKVGTLLKVQNLSTAFAEAFAKLRSVPISEFERVINSTPAPNEHDKEAVVVIEKQLTKAPELSVMSMAIKNKQDGIQAVFDCLFKHDLIEDILRSSVDRLKDMPKGFIRDESEDAMDLPTALEFFIAIVEVNAGGFAQLGKFSSLLDIFKPKAEEPAQAEKA